MADGMNDMRAIVKQITLAEARLWLAYCVAAGIVTFIIEPKEANA